MSFQTFSCINYESTKARRTRAHLSRILVKPGFHMTPTNHRVILSVITEEENVSDRQKILLMKDQQQ